MIRQLAIRNDRSSPRHGFTYVELIMAMLSSTVLVVALAATVAVTTQLFDVPPPDQQQLHDREIVDRLAADLRYATSIDDTTPSGFRITRPDLNGGTPETASYESYMDGLTRRVGSQPRAKLDPDSPSHSFAVDGYSAPTYTPSPLSAKVRSASREATDFKVHDHEIAPPDGCKPGDLLLLCISAKDPDEIEVDFGWQRLAAVQRGDLHLFVYWQNYYDGMPDTEIEFWPNSSMAAVMVAIENANTSSSPIAWSNTSRGYAYWYDSSSHPRPQQPSAIGARDLNVQIFAAEVEPWYSGSLGLASFSDVVIATSSIGDWDESSSVGVAVRNGPIPAMSTTPRAMHWQSGRWALVSLQVEAGH